MDFLTLSELNGIVSAELKQSFPENYWIVAETSDVRLNSNGHCYLEFIEKNPHTNSVIAKARGYIWNNTFRMLNPYFESKTGQQFATGLKVLVKVGIEFHPLYGYGLNVCDIDPTYTLGDMQAQRLEILRRLEEDGVLNLNKELDFPLLPQRVAVISSSTAAGYEDFLDHLHNNNQGFVFYTKLFPAVMQGEQTTGSIVTALEQIYKDQDYFDVVVIIRGGGASSDLAAFDSYLLGSHCAQFPLPIITGIGHERDDSILDFVAYYRAKTPTAVADFLTETLSEAYTDLIDLQKAICSDAMQLLQTADTSLQSLSANFRLRSSNLLQSRENSVDLIRLKIQSSCREFLNAKHSKLNEIESYIKLSSPEYILSKGYSITLKNGKTVKTAKELAVGDEIETVLAEGRVKSKVAIQS